MTARSTLRSFQSTDVVLTVKRTAAAAAPTTVRRTSTRTATATVTVQSMIVDVVAVAMAFVLVHNFFSPVASSTDVVVDVDGSVGGVGVGVGVDAFTLQVLRHRHRHNHGCSFRRSSSSGSSTSRLFYMNNSTIIPAAAASAAAAERTTTTTMTTTEPQSQQHSQRRRQESDVLETTPRRPVIYCDMDGVLVDFEGGVRRVLRESTRSYGGLVPAASPGVVGGGGGVVDAEKRRKQLWKQLQLKGTRIWFRTLDWTSDGRILWEHLRPLRPTILSGVPYMLVPHACQDKYEWCLEHLFGSGQSSSSAAGSRKPVAATTTTATDHPAAAAAAAAAEVLHIDMAALNCPTNNGHVRVNNSNSHSRNEDPETTARQPQPHQHRQPQPLQHQPHRVITCWSHNKHLECKEPGSILIDDRLDLGEAWTQAGGVFVHHTTAENTVKQLQRLGVLDFDDVEDEEEEGDEDDDDDDDDDTESKEGTDVRRRYQNTPNEPSSYYWDGSSCPTTRKWGWW